LHYRVKHHDRLHLTKAIFAFNLGIDCPVKSVGVVMYQIHLGEVVGDLVGKPEDTRFQTAVVDSESLRILNPGITEEPPCMGAVVRLEATHQES